MIMHTCTILCGNYHNIYRCTHSYYTLMIILLQWSIRSHHYSIHLYSIAPLKNNTISLRGTHIKILFINRALALIIIIVNCYDITDCKLSWHILVLSWYIDIV